MTVLDYFLDWEKIRLTILFSNNLINQAGKTIPGGKPVSKPGSKRLLCKPQDVEKEIISQYYLQTALNGSSAILP